MRKFLFLDIDGVLNSDRFFTDEQISKVNSAATPFDRDVALLDRDAVWMLTHFLLQNPSVYVVISSTWRKLHTLDEIKSFLIRKDSCFPKERIIGRTPYDTHYRSGSMGNYRMRGEEVETWIENNINRIEDDPIFVCLDDDNDFLEYQKVVLTDPRYGLQKSDIDKLQAIFNGEV